MISKLINQGVNTPLVNRPSCADEKTFLEWSNNTEVRACYRTLLHSYRAVKDESVQPEEIQDEPSWPFAMAPAPDRALQRLNNRNHCVF